MYVISFYDQANGSDDDCSYSRSHKEFNIIIFIHNSEAFPVPVGVCFVLLWHHHCERRR